MQSVKMIRELYNMFQLANEKFYNKELPEPQILIVPAKGRPVLGYCTAKPVWGTEENADQYEIAISAEYLRRGPEEIMGTLLHEMVHYYNGIHEVNDCTKTQYHKKVFKEVAQAHGLKVEKTRNRGFSSTSLTEESKEWFASLALNKDVFKVSRQIAPKIGSSYKKPYKYQCPICGAKIYSRKPVTATCSGCGEFFETID